MYIVEVSLQIKMDNLEIMGQKIQTKAKMTQLQQRKSFSTLNWVAHSVLEIENSTIKMPITSKAHFHATSKRLKYSWN